jgi:hypothetical protein
VTVRSDIATPQWSNSICCTGYSDGLSNGTVHLVVNKDKSTGFFANSYSRVTVFKHPAALLNHVICIDTKPLTSHSLSFEYLVINNHLKVG